MGYALRIARHAVEVVSGAEQTPGIVAAEDSGANVRLRSKWGGGKVRVPPKMIPQGMARFLKVQARRRRPVIPTRRLRVGSLPPPLRACSPANFCGLIVLVPRSSGCNPVSPNLLVAAGHGGIGLGFHLGPGSIRPFASLGRRLGRRREVRVRYV